MAYLCHIFKVKHEYEEQEQQNRLDFSIFTHSTDTWFLFLILLLAFRRTDLEQFSLSVPL